MNLQFIGDREIIQRKCYQMEEKYEDLKDFLNIVKNWYAFWENRWTENLIKKRKYWRFNMKTVDWRGIWRKPR